MALNFRLAELTFNLYGRVYSLHLELKPQVVVVLQLTTPPHIHTHTHNQIYTRRTWWELYLPPVFISKKSTLGIHPNNNFGFLSMGEATF